VRPVALRITASYACRGSPELEEESWGNQLDQSPHSTAHHMVLAARRLLGSTIMHELDRLTHWTYINSSGLSAWHGLSTTCWFHNGRLLIPPPPSPQLHAAQARASQLQQTDEQTRVQLLQLRPVLAAVTQERDRLQLLFGEQQQMAEVTAQRAERASQREAMAEERLQQALGRTADLEAAASLSAGEVAQQAPAVCSVAYTQKQAAEWHLRALTQGNRCLVQWPL